MMTTKHVILNKKTNVHKVRRLTMIDSVQYTIICENDIRPPPTLSENTTKKPERVLLRRQLYNRAHAKLVRLHRQKYFLVVGKRNTGPAP